MSKKDMESDGFTLVTKKNKRLWTRRRQVTCKSKIADNDDDGNNGSLGSTIDMQLRNKVLRQLEKQIEEMKSSEFYASFKKDLNAMIVNLQSDHANKPEMKVDKIVCLGLGNFSYSNGSCAQLALIKCVKEELECSTIEFYDPVFTATEKYILNDDNNGHKLSTTNLVGKYTVEDVDDDKILNLILFYLPHCPFHLINNLLFANWQPNKISKCIIIGNNLDKMKTNATPDMNGKIDYILRALDVAEIKEIENSFNYFNVFNDSAINAFPRSRLVPFLDNNAFWELTEPVYEDNGEELIVPEATVIAVNLETYLDCPF